MLNPNCWNEFDRLKTVIVCTPSCLDIPDQKTADYVQWEKPVQSDKARASFEGMVDAMKTEGVEVINYCNYLSKEDQNTHKQLINRYFTRDLACSFGSIFIPGEAGTSLRRPEYRLAHPLFEKWTSPDQYSVDWNDPLHALEFGDVLLLSRDAVFINVGLRSSHESARLLKDRLLASGFSEVGIIDLPRQGAEMHLDMNCAIIGATSILCKSYMRFFPVEVWKEDGASYMMTGPFLERHGYSPVWTDDVKHTVADINFLNLDPETILISTKANKKILKEDVFRKKRLIEIDVDELEKGGGGIRCMTLPVTRE
ncbi:arginine deiminase family protein [Halobacillus sp. ACCC02827]|uniref:arginine deiminase family protein n=1 Tax=Bacillaceae TaxID=186817 RepID=UPI0002A5131B|nr:MULTISPECIES: arginine deiminase family protein [Bacillaceae]ELK48008.1 hypothetical protein D479_04598 [Halobacillus sp. BAB-2008]QHT47582.1 arginine deiminase [Bacillus sp. SB49]WJE14814.1 arginine deiminase family protein [Halobacillus sp. ACCC02827]